MSFANLFRAPLHKIYTWKLYDNERTFAHGKIKSGGKYLKKMKKINEQAQRRKKEYHSIKKSVRDYSALIDFRLTFCDK